MRRHRHHRGRGGRRREYSYADGRAGRPLKWAMIALLVLAALIVIASVIH